MANDQSKGISWADLVAVVLLAMIGGVFVGGLLGAWLGEREMRSITAAVREKDPHETLDGPGILFVAYIVVYVIRGWLIGTTVGVCLALALWLKTSRNERQD
jgi:hypothetical protein